jgi:UDP-N-acetylmuramyl pentapeptide phosphotransferase/UDP-N-acetylglucosamine-1-phosphate transferase
VILAGTILGFVLSAWLTWRFCDPKSRFHILDHPNERSLHAQSTPRSGGLAILVAIVASVAMVSLSYSLRDLAAVAAGFLIVAGVSFLDDRFSIAPGYRLLVHALVAAIILSDDFYLRTFDVPGAVWQWHYSVAAVFSVLYTVWMINLYNFMDGMDGFAGGMAVAGFVIFAVSGWMAGHDAFFVTSLIIAAACGGFLVFNFPPARIFMGDIGSSTLGLLAAAFSLWGARDGIFPFWTAVLAFSPFIADATVTLVRRFMRREKLWHAHRTHFYQQLVQSGWGHRKTVLLEYAIMTGCGASALLGMRASATMQTVILAGWILFYAGFFSWVAWHAAGGRRNSA